MANGSIVARVEADEPYARLRGALTGEADLDRLVADFAAAIATDGLDGHLCVAKVGGRATAMFGDSLHLLNSIGGCDIPATDGGAVLRLRRPPPAAARARVRGYAALYVARGLTLSAVAVQPLTECGLSLCQRIILGRLLVGKAPLDVALDLEISVDLVREMLRRAVRVLEVNSIDQAVALAARRGWLLTTATHFPALSSRDISYSC